MRCPAILLRNPAPKVYTLPARDRVSSRAGSREQGAGVGSRVAPHERRFPEKSPASTVLVIVWPPRTGPRTMPPLRRRRPPPSTPRKRPVGPVPVCYEPARRRPRHPPPRLRQQRGRAPPPHRGQARLARSPRGSSRRGGCPCTRGTSLPTLRRSLSAPSPIPTATHPRPRQRQGVPA